ncbi:ABC transporter permease [Nesterenkonia rhizosphaerae]|uniref:ABC transmembrane type-1 domain-containing protein n=1 Tax=Nesterenkonia rhizosphaerae TaxID=1348272 RepID=A0ABP9FPS8_9MICC
MLKYILKRLGSTVLILFGATLIAFIMVINSGDPLQDLREMQSDNVEFLMQERIERMGLDQPWYVRYWSWLSGILGCFAGSCDFGVTMSGQPVTPLILAAAEQSLRLVFVATMVAIVVGILTGIATAMRQYSLLDYVVTFFIFLFWSLPVFWAAVLAKEWLAIRFNDWILEPQFTWPAILTLAALLAIIVPLVLGGDPLRRIITGGIMFAFVCLVLPWMNAVNFMASPRLGVPIIIVASLVLAAGFTALIAGIRNRQVLYSTLLVVLVGIVAYYATWGLLQDPPGGWLLLGALFVLTVTVCVIIGRIVGGDARGQATAASVLTGVMMSILILLDHFMYHWPQLLSLKPRPIRTVGSHTPNLDSDFWVTALDQLTQLWMPSVLMALLSLATYTRYTRSSMLEVQKQDYIRTARAKGVNERTVVLKHAFRNAMIPLVTIVAFDFAALISGSVVVERVFGWNAMGNLFITGLQISDPAPVMAFIIVTGAVAVLFNLMADILYAVLDPRIRV